MSPWRQRFKWTVYALLFFDFVLYLVQDIQSAQYTLDSRSTFLELTGAYVTSIDLVAWFALILLFELETWVLAGRPWTGSTKWRVRGVRIVCYVAILHTSFSYDIALREFLNPERLPDASDVCEYADGGWSFLRNRGFVEIDGHNCSALGVGPEFYALSDDSVITDRAGLREGRILAGTDLVESVAWLLVVFLTELAVRSRDGAIGGARLLAGLGRIKVALYALILAIALYWGSKGQYLYFWDEVIWVFGFVIIDGNIRGRRGARQPVSASLPAS